MCTAKMFFFQAALIMTEFNVSMRTRKILDIVCGNTSHDIPEKSKYYNLKCKLR